MKALTAALASTVLLYCSAACVCAQTASNLTTSDPQALTTSPQSLNDYISASGEPLSIPQLGITVRDGSAKLDGRLVNGVAVVEVSSGGSSAGVLDDHHTSRMMVTGALIGAGAAAAVMFPPAIIAVVMVAHAREAAETYDLIIAIDGNRVRNTLDLVDAVQEAGTGDVIYLTIVRSGLRQQLVVHVH